MTIYLGLHVRLGRALLDGALRCGSDGGRDGARLAFDKSVGSGCHEAQRVVGLGSHILGLGSHILGLGSHILGLGSHILGLGSAHTLVVLRAEIGEGREHDEAGRRRGLDSPRRQESKERQRCEPRIEEPARAELLIEEQEHCP